MNEPLVFTVKGRIMMMKKLMSALRNERGEYYHARWMAMHGIPPVPLWTVGWFFDLADLVQGRRKR